MDQTSRSPESETPNSMLINNFVPENKLGVLAQKIENYLMAQPKPDAPAVAKASVLPLLYSFKQEIWNPRYLRQIAARDKYLRYGLVLSEGEVSIDIWAIEQDFKDEPASNVFPEGGPWGVRTNGSDWQLIDFSQDSPDKNIFDFSLYSGVFHEIMFQLFNPQKDSLEQRFMLGKSLLLEDMLVKKLYMLVNASGPKALEQNDFQEILQTLYSSGFITVKERSMLKNANMQEALDNYIENIKKGYVPIIKPLSDITLEDVERHCKAVGNLKGGLEVYFNDNLLAVSSRSGYYYLLAAIAVQFGLSNTIPAEDLVRPPEQPAEGVKKHFLGRPGWYLVIKNRNSIEDSIASLLKKLRLQDRFKATYNAAPFPSSN